MSFRFLKDVVLIPEDFNISDQKVFIEDFLYSNTITLIYSPPKQGKTWFGYGLAEQNGIVCRWCGMAMECVGHGVETRREESPEETGSKVSATTETKRKRVGRPRTGTVN